MYTTHFGLTEKPFSLIPQAEAIYFSRGHMAAFSMLEFGLLESVGITVITGEVGTGKTTLIRHLLRRLDYDKLTVGLISTAHHSFGTLLKWTVSAFRLKVESDDEAVLLRELQNFLIQEYAQGKRTVVICDEAQNIDAQDLESLRLLTNINADRAQLLQVVLVGQPQLRETFYDPRMSQLAQRVSAEYNLAPLSLIESISYVRYRVQKAGANRKLFETNALLAVFYYSGGIPRIINTLCDGALVFAYGLGEQTVTIETVMEVVRNKQIGGIHRPGIDSDPARETVRADVKMLKGVDLLELVG